MSGATTGVRSGGTGAPVSSGAHSGASGIVSRIEEGPGGDALASDLQLVCPAQDMIAIDAGRVAHVTVAQAPADRVAVTGAGEPADPLAVSVDRLSAQQHHLGARGKAR